MFTKEPLKGKIIDILITLNKKEIKAFENYVQSPYFNKDKKVIHLLQLILKKAPHFKKLYKQDLFQKIFDTKSNYKDNFLRALCTRLTKLMEGFLSQQEYEQEHSYRNLWLADAYRKKRLNGLFEKQLSVAQNEQNKIPFKDIEFFYQQFLLDELSYQYTTITNNRATNTSLQDVVNNLDRYYLATKLRYASVILNRQRIVDVEYKQWLVDEILLFLKQQSFQNTPAIHLYYQLVLLLSYLENDHYFYQLKASLLKEDEKLPKSEVRQIYTMLLNCCRWRINEGDTKFGREAYELYRRMLDLELLYVRGFISHHHFRNIVTFALEVNEFEWTKQFIYKYKETVIPKFRENVFNYNMASLFFAQKDYDKTMEYLQTILFSEVDFIDFYYFMYYKVLLIQTSFVLDEVELLLSNLESFRIYLSRNKSIPEGIRTGRSNFVKLVKKLLNLKMEKRINSDDLNEEIKTVSPLINRSWLQEMFISIIN